MRWSIGLLLPCLLLFPSGCDWVRDVQRRQLFRPEQTTPHPEVADSIEGLERWWLQVEGGEVEAWYLPPLATDESRGGAVIFAHGNQELIDDYPAVLRPYREMGFAVLLPEYRSYGRSGGEPGEAAILGDFAYFYDRLADRPEIDRRRIVMHGRSLGGGVAGCLSDRRTAAALVLESTFTNMPDIGSRWFAPIGAFSDRFDTRDVLMRSSTPTLILHGVDDELIPFEHAVENHRVAWDSRLVAFRSGHSDLPRSEVAYWARIRDFLIEAEVLSPR